MEYKNDIDWLLAKHPYANELLQEDFAERVAIMIVDGGVKEADARRLAEQRLFGHKPINLHNIN